MAIRTFNSVGGFSVGETPETIILANGDITTDFATFTANVDAGNVKTDHLLYANGVPWDFQEAAGSANGQVQYYLDGQFGASANFSFNSITNTLTVTGNSNVTNTLLTGNLRTDNLLYANGVAWDLQEAAGSDTQIQFNTGDNFDASTNFTFDKTSSVLTVTGNIETGNLHTTGNIAIDGKAVVTGNVEAPRFIGNLIGSISGGNVNIGATDKTIAFTKGSNLYYSSNLQFDYTSNVLTLVGNLITGNADLGNLATANFFHGVLDATSSAQPNIHTVGTLDYLDVDTTITATDVETGNLSVSARVLTSLIPANDNTVDLGSSTLAWRNVWAGSNVFVGSSLGYIRAIGNVIQVDALTAANRITANKLTIADEALLQGDVTVSGNLTVGGTTTYINVASLDIKDPLISLGGSGSGGNLSAYDGKDRGLWLRNRTSDDTAVNNQALYWSTGNDEFRAMTGVTVTNEVVTGTYANIHAEKFIGNVSGTILTASQTQITTVGTLTNLDVAGTLTVDTHASIASLEASGLQYPLVDGDIRQVLSTDGAGELYWATIDTYRLANGTSNVTVTGPGPDSPTGLGGNIAISVAGVSNVVVISETLTTIDEDLTVTGTTNTGDLVIGDSKVGSATLTTTATTERTIIGLPVANFRAVEFFVKGEDSVSTPKKYSVATISAVHNSVDEVEWSTYGGVHSGASTGTFNVVYDGENNLVLLNVNPSSGNETVWTVQYRTI